MSDICTFDIWDTCITRSFAFPQHLFFEAAARLVGCDEFTSVEVAELALHRQQSETEARASAPGGECTFEEIITALEKKVGAEGARRFAELELQLERESARPVNSALTKIEEARARGCRIAFLSDMYLPSIFLGELLRRYGFARSGDEVIVSCEHRASKWQGDLFRAARQRLDVSEKRWWHLGDKRHADVQVPRSLGIQAEVFSCASLTTPENRALESANDTPRAASRLAAGMRGARVGSQRPAPDSAVALISNVIGPWLCAVAARMVRQARDAGLDRLYFLSRDGEILMRIAKTISSDSLDCRYLHSSRRSWCFPAMVVDDSASLRWLRTFPGSPGDILRSLMFYEHEQAQILGQLGIEGEEIKRRRPTTDLEFLWDHLRRKGLMAVVLQRAAEARKPLLVYLRQQGLMDDDRWAVADIGWSLNVQAALTRLLRLEQPRAVARGTYFMVGRNRPPLEQTGPFSCWLLEEAMSDAENPITETIRKLSGLIEEVFLTNADPSTTGFRLESETTACPFFAKEAPDAFTEGHAGMLRHVVDKLAMEWREEIRSPAFSRELEKFALAELIRFFRAPTREEAEALLPFVHSSESTAGHKEACPLVRPYHLRDAAAIILRRARLRRQGVSRDPMWHEGSIAVSSPAAVVAMGIAVTRLRRDS